MSEANDRDATWHGRVPDREAASVQPVASEPCPEVGTALASAMNIAAHHATPPAASARRARRSLAALVALVATLMSGCLFTDTIDFPDEVNYPPSIVAAPGGLPMNRIAHIDRSTATSDDLTLDVIVRDPNEDQTLRYRVFVDDDTFDKLPVLDGDLAPLGTVDRHTIIRLPLEALGVAGRCHRVELIVTSAFSPSGTALREPATPGDVDDASWWIELTDADHPSIERACL